MHKFIVQLLVFSSLLFCGLASAKAEPSAKREFSSQKYEKLKTKKAYRDFIEYEDSYKENMGSKLAKYIGHLLKKLFGFKYAAKLFEAIPYIIIVIAVLLIVLRMSNIELSRLFKARQKIGTVHYETAEEENIHKIDLDAELNKALAENDYRLAFRYQYLRLLKALDNMELINWEPAKSNYDYVGELHASPIQTDFMQQTKLFDYVWYGEMPLASESYHQLIKQSNKLIQQTNQFSA